VDSPAQEFGSADYEHRFRIVATNTADETDRFVTEYVADGEPIASDLGTTRACSHGHAAVRLRRRIDTSR